MQTNGDRNIFLSTLPAGKGDRRLALAVVCISFVLFVIAVVAMVGTKLWPPASGKNPRIS